MTCIYIVICLCVCVCVFVSLLFCKRQNDLIDVINIKKKQHLPIKFRKKKKTNKILSETVDSIENYRELLLCGRIYKTV